MLAVAVIEQLFRIGARHLKPLEITSPPPGAIGSEILLPIAVIISSSRKGLNMVNLVPTKETDNHVQTYKQDYPNNPFRASPKRLCEIGS
jgi:hypothetical protein